MMELAKQALCYKVMALAVMQFDVTELPRAIRYDDSHEYSNRATPSKGPICITNLWPNIPH